MKFKFEVPNLNYKKISLKVKKSDLNKGPFRILSYSFYRQNLRPLLNKKIISF